MTDKPLGAYERHESPDYADGGVTAAQVEKEAEQHYSYPDSPARYWHDRWEDSRAMAALWKETARSLFRARRAWRDRSLPAEAERDRAWTGHGSLLMRAARALDLPPTAGSAAILDAITDLRDRAEKAEQERDHWKREADGANADLAHLRAAESRPVEVTAEMVERAQDRGRELLGVVWDREVVGAMIIAALIEPPARPEGAEEIEAYMREIVASHPEDHYGELADHLASRGVLPPITDKTNPVSAPEDGAA